MKKKILGVVLVITLVFAMLSFGIFDLLSFEIIVNESPNGD